MYVLSIDVGIKNLAMCILSDQNNKPEIHLWDVVNLIQTNDVNSVEFKCNCYLQSKSKKSKTTLFKDGNNDNLCGKNAKYSKGEHLYCLQHAKKTSFIIPTKKTTSSFIKKQKLYNAF